MGEDAPLVLSIQFVEPLTEYWYLVMASVPDVDRLILILDVVTLVLLIVGAEGSVTFVLEAALPFPLPLKALT